MTSGGALLSIFQYRAVKLSSNSANVKCGESHMVFLLGRARIGGQACPTIHGQPMAGGRCQGRRAKRAFTAWGRHAPYGHAEAWPLQVKKSAQRGLDYTCTGDTL
jgi:hypothetical protein